LRDVTRVVAGAAAGSAFIRSSEGAFSHIRGFAATVAFERPKPVEIDRCDHHGAVRSVNAGRQLSKLRRLVLTQRHTSIMNDG